MANNKMPRRTSFIIFYAPYKNIFVERASSRSNRKHPRNFHNAQIGWAIKNADTVQCIYFFEGWWPNNVITVTLAEKDPRHDTAFDQEQR